MIILNLIRGMFMAFADSVPGVSGGTIAFIMGFYNEFITSINTLVASSSRTHKKKALVFLMKIGLGWIVGMVISIFLISAVFEHHIYAISSLFVGFILFSIPVVLKQEKHHLKNEFSHFIYLVIGILLVTLITYFNPVASNSIQNINIRQLSPSLAFYIFCVGAIAISAMILPGISGSTLLLIFGLYTPIINGLKHTMLLDFSYLPMLIIFGMGILFGVITVIRILNHLLKSRRSELIYFILGLMLGSLYAVFMGPTTLDRPLSPMDFRSFNFIFFLIGGLIILLLDSISSPCKS